MKLVSFTHNGGAMRGGVLQDDFVQPLRASLSPATQSALGHLRGRSGSNATAMVARWRRDGHQDCTAQNIGEPNAHNRVMQGERQTQCLLLAF